MGEVSFFYQTEVSFLRDRTKLKNFMLKTAQGNGHPIDSLNVIFCGDDYLLSINKQFLRHDFFTDIITFDLSPTPKRLEAELYISIDRVRDNAKSLSIPFYHELHRVIFHGLLHLLGYKDKLKEDQLTMRSMEEKLLKRYFG
ncbi:MAG: rRNA maturation RNase YbeY [Chitinophagaceae bacterium]|nr:MAG: rRNA maturation RNase YbeY [Chitinophagaceae bacterium]